VLYEAVEPGAPPEHEEEEDLGNEECAIWHETEHISGTIH
jgi:hypothetical protein